MNVTVRRATAEDAPGLARLRWKWRSEERGEIGTDRAAFVDFVIGWVVDHLPTHVPFVAEVDGRLAGMAFLVLTDRTPSPGRLDRRAGDIQSVYVLPELRNAGVGAQVIAEIQRYAADRELVYVTVHAASAAIQFYRRWGFTLEDQMMIWHPPQ